MLAEGNVNGELIPVDDNESLLTTPNTDDWVTGVSDNGFWFPKLGNALDEFGAPPCEV